jgi:carboxymethylenebutenolidase
MLQALDGTEVAAFAATADRAGSAGIVVMPDVRGLHPFYVDVAERFAEAGVHAVAIDYFGRTATPEVRGEGFDHMPHVRRTTPEGIAADVNAAVAHLRSDQGGAARKVFTVGFCFGGRNSLNQAAEGHGLAGAIGFYPGMGEHHEGDPNTPIRRAAAYRCPILALFGGADAGIPPEQVEEFRRAVDDAGVANEIVVYDGAPHSFFDRRFAEYREQSADAWRRVLAFIGSTD